MKVTHLTIRQTADAWVASDGRSWDTAAEAERDLRATAPVGMLVVDWETTTWVGAAVVQALGAAPAVGTSRAYFYIENDAHQQEVDR